MKLADLIMEKYSKNSDLYRKITYIQELLDNGQVSEAKRELEYLRQELHNVNK